MVHGDTLRSRWTPFTTAYFPLTAGLAAVGAVAGGGHFVVRLAVGAFGLAVFAWWLLVVRSLGVELQPQQIVLHGLFGRTVISRSQTATFERRGYAVYLHAGDRRLHAWGLGPPLWKPTASDELVQGLNRQIGGTAR